MDNYSTLPANGGADQFLESFIRINNQNQLSESILRDIHRKLPLFTEEIEGAARIILQ